jgi:hypothetical protein
MTKRAVCAGINDYSVRGYNNLQSARQDAEAWASTLADAFGYDSANVTLLKDSAATSAAVLSAVTKMLNQSEAGDVACLFFAGHGGRSQSADASTWLEYICCYDANGNIDNATFDALAAALSPSTVNFTLVLDSCHSGGAFDADNSARTPLWSGDQATTFLQSCTSIIPHVLLTDLAKMANNIEIVKNDDGSCSLKTDEQLYYSDAASATLFAACAYNENAGDGTNHGAFTQALLDIINSSNFQINHPDFLDKARKAIAPYSTTQTPQLRGRPVRLEENFLDGWNYSV